MKIRANVSSNASGEVDPESLQLRGSSAERGGGLGGGGSSERGDGGNSAAGERDKAGNKAGASMWSWGRGLKMAFCFFGLQFSYVLWGLFQERLMTKEYNLGKFKSSTFCVFGNRVLALIIAAAVVLFKRFNLPKGAVVKDAPYHVYAPFSISNSVSSWAQYEALKFISFPTQVLAKSCKIIFVMMVGICVNRKSYALVEYLDALLITAGVAMFSFSEKTGGGGRGSLQQQQDDTSYGIMLLCVYLVCDSFTSQWQSRVFKQMGVDQYQAMLGGSIWSCILTATSLYLSGEGTESMQFMMADLSALSDSVVLSVTSAVGQLFIFYTVKEFGPVVFTIMMTTRQILSLFLSCLLFSHPMHLLGWLGASTVFVVVFNRIRRGERD